MNEKDKKLFDTYEAMNEDEKRELMLIQKIKSNVKFFIGTDEIIKKITQLIDESKSFSFNNERNKKYISKVKPLFVIKPNIKNISRELTYISSTDKNYIINNEINPKYKKDVDFLQQKAYDEIINPYNTFLMSFLIDNDKFTELLKNNGLKEVTIDKKTINLITMMSSTMFAVRVDLAGGRVYLEYAI